MEELIQLVSEKAGITPEQAKDAITTIIDHFKDKLPFGMGDKLESFISADGASGSATAGEGVFNDLKGKVSGFFS